MKEISEKELNKLVEIIYLFHVEKNQKQFRRFINRLKALNKKYKTEQLREKVAILIDLLILEYLESLELKFLKTLLTSNCDVTRVREEVIGFYLPPDQQIVPLPVPIHIVFVSDDQKILIVQFAGLEKEKKICWQNLGFEEAIPLPYQYKKIEDVNALVVKRYVCSQAKEYGFSPPVTIIIPRTVDVWREVEDSIKKVKTPAANLMRITGDSWFLDR